MMLQIFALFFGVFIFFGFSDASASSNACQMAKNTADEIVCAQDKYDLASTALVSAYEELENLQEDGLLVAFRDAQQQWVAYRDLECRWEAENTSETESLDRLHELRCLIDTTKKRSTLLATFQGDDAQDVSHDVAHSSSLVLDSPRWFNTLVQGNPGIFWGYADRYDVDLNCDDRAEPILIGLKYEDNAYTTVLAVSENPITGLPYHALFDLDGCSSSISFDVIEREGVDLPLCKAALSVNAEGCSQRVLMWDGGAYQLTAGVVSNPVE